MKSFFKNNPFVCFHKKKKPKPEPLIGFSFTIYKPKTDTDSKEKREKEEKEKEKREESSEKSISSFFHLDHNPSREKEKEKEKEKEHSFIVNPFHVEKQVDSHHKIATNTEKPKSTGFSWQDSVFIYFHPNLLLDKYIKKYIEWKTDIIKKRLGYPYSLYLLGSIAFTSCFYYYYCYYFNT
jgi:hypothetical protein